VTLSAAAVVVGAAAITQWQIEILA